MKKIDYFRDDCWNARIWYSYVRSNDEDAEWSVIHG